MASDPNRLSTPPQQPTWDAASLLEFAGSLAASSSEFAHDANNLVLQVVAAQEIVGDKLGSPIATDEEIAKLMEYARNISTIARDLALLVESKTPSQQPDE